jgi:O-antigen/teichoic acid export membrane protein
VREQRCFLSLVRSVSWNYLGYFCELTAGVLLFAYVVRHISVEDYGLFLLAQSIAAFLFLLDFGLSNVLIQVYVSTRASGGMTDVSRLASTLLVSLFGIGALGVVVLSLLAMLVPKVINLPVGQTHVALQVLILSAMGAQLSLTSLPLDHLCQAFHRFDRINQVQVAIVALRVVLTVIVLALGKGIVALAAVQVVLSLARLLALWAVARASLAGLDLNLLCFDLFRLRKVMKVSGWAFGDDVSRRIGMNSESLILAGLGSFRQVALFGMASRLPAHLYQFAARGVSVILPSLSRNHAEGDAAQLRVTYQNAYRVCLTGFLPLVVYAAICSRQLVQVWAGVAYLGAAPVLVWLLVSAMSQVMEFPSDLVLYSHDRIRQAAGFSVIETMGKILFALALVVPFGAAGVAAGVAIWHWCVNLFFYLPAACRVASIRPLDLWRGSVTGGFAQVAAFVFGVIALCACSRRFTPMGVFAALAAVCLMHSGVWLWATALPIWKATAGDVALTESRSSM